MAVSMYAPVNRPLSSSASLPVAIPRAQVGIDRIPGRRASNEPRESMNCKSCRKRKIKCNRLRPSCEACQVFQCDCIYDAIPKKRGPKTDVLEALMRRVDGLEAKLKEKRAVETSLDSLSSSASSSSSSAAEKLSVEHANPPSSASSDCSATETAHHNKQRNISTGDIDMGNGPEAFDQAAAAAASHSIATDRREDAPPPTSPAVTTTVTVTEELINTYFLHFHGQPYHVLEELSFRQEFKLGQIPPYLANAVCALACRHTPHPDGYGAAAKSSDSFANKARSQIDTDEPSIHALQALLLLVSAFTAAGKGRKAYMMMTSAVGMAVALELHCEVGTQAHMAPVQRETRRRLFWTCYILDRFLACGSKRPSLIPDSTIVLRLPSWVPDGRCTPIEGEFFQSTSRMPTTPRFSVPATSESSGVPQTKTQCSYGLLVGISKILGMTNQYLATGGVKADAHFPWNPASKLVKIVQELEAWDADTADVFASLPSVLQHPEATILVLSKLVYHAIYCLIYRPFLPVDATEMHRLSQHQTWQIQTTRACLSHADAIVKLVAAGRQARSIQWPAFVTSCLCVAATVHIHGSHYPAGLTVLGADMAAVAAASSGYLVQELQFLEELRYSWAVVQPHIATLHALGRAHAELVHKCANNPQSVFSDFRRADFFDRYACAGAPKFHFDAAHMGLSDGATTTAAAAASTGVQNDVFVASPRANTSPLMAQQQRSSYAGRKMSSATAASVPALVPGFYTPQLQTISLANAAFGCVSPVDDLSPHTTSAFSFPAQSTATHAHSSPLAAAASIIPGTDASMHDSVAQAALIAVSSAGYSLSAEAPLVGADAGTGGFDTSSYAYATSSNGLDASVAAAAAAAAAAVGYESLFGFTEVPNWAGSNDVAEVARQQRTTAEKDLELLFAEGLVSSSG